MTKWEKGFFVNLRQFYDYFSCYILNLWEIMYFECAVEVCELGFIIVAVLYSVHYLHFPFDLYGQNELKQHNFLFLGLSRSKLLRFLSIPHMDHNAFHSFEVSKYPQRDSDAAFSPE